MANLFCDICGGKLTIGAGGVATCSQCGMEYTKERIKEKLAEGGVPSSNSSASEAAAKKDDSQAIKDYLELANTSYNSHGFEETIKYSDKIIDLDLKNSEAWILKAKALMYSSSGENGRLKEGVTALINGVKYASEDEFEETSKEAWEFLTKILGHTTQFAAEGFSNVPCQQTADTALVSINQAISSVNSYIKETETNPFKEYFYKDMLEQFNKAINYTYKNYIYYHFWDVYAAKGLKPERDAYLKYLSEIDFCDDIIKRLMDVVDDKPLLMELTKTENYILKEKRDSLAYKANVGSMCTTYMPAHCLDNSARAEIDRIITKNNTDISKYNEELKIRAEKRKVEWQALVAKYWKENPEERKPLDEELAKFNDEKAKLDAELKKEKDKADEKILAKNNEISELDRKISSLGLFKFKEKSDLKLEKTKLKSDIDSINAELAKKKQEIQGKIIKVDYEIQKINDKLEYPLNINKKKK